MAQVLGIMEYDAVGLGEKDLAFGRGFLERMQEEHGVRFVTTNAVDKKTGEPIFAPYRVAEREGYRVGFLGVVSPERHVVTTVQGELDSHQIKLLDPTEAVRARLPELREKCDLVVLLAHCGIESSRFLAQDLAVDVVVVGHFPAILNRPEREGNAILAMAGSKSDRFGTLNLMLADDGTVADFGGDSVRLLRTGPENFEIAAIWNEIDQKEKEAKRERQLAAQRARDQALKERAQQDIHIRGDVFGAEACAACHQPVYESWVETPHATAFATLAEADSWDDPECIGCHVTGIEDKSFVHDVNLAPEVWNVQCEECHGSGFEHARDGSYVTEGETTCLKCHNPENSPEFDYEVYSAYGVH